MAIQVKIKNQTEEITKVVLDKDSPHVHLQTAGKYVSEDIAIDLEGADLVDATATAGDILMNKSAYVAGGNNVTGTMTNNGAVSQTITTPSGSYSIPSGYHNGSGVVSVNIPVYDYSYTTS